METKTDWNEFSRNFFERAESGRITAEAYRRPFSTKAGGDSPPSTCGAGLRQKTALMRPRPRRRRRCKKAAYMPSPKFMQTAGKEQVSPFFSLNLL